MPLPNDAASIEDRELVLTRLIDAPAEKLYRAWTDPTLIVRWFTPPPWKTVAAELDVRPGGSSYVLMRGPNGEEMPNRGVYLEVIPNRKLVFTDAFVKAWEPSGHAFMTGTLTFEPRGTKTLYTARVQHWSVADREAHEQMGFHAGWGIATDQLAALAATL